MQYLLAQALHEIPNVKSGLVFTVSDLFVGHVWKGMDLKTRRTLGRLFCMDSMNPYLVSGEIIPVDSEKANQQRYQKK